jgi:bifunctional non-homologous end joining protein LigD
LQNRAGLYSKAHQRRKNRRNKNADMAESTPDLESVTLVFYAFDLIYLNGYDLRGATLVERKKLLQSLLSKDSKRSPLIQYSEHFVGEAAGQTLLEEAKALNLEGVMAKHASSTYKERRSEQWQKLKLVQTLDVVIGGYTQPRRSRSHFGALVIGLYKDKKLHYVGHTGSGFNTSTLKSTFALLQELQTEQCPFAEKPHTNEPAVWIKPKLVCEVKFTEWTDDGNLRHPIFLRLRPDKEAKECIFDTQIPLAEKAESTLPRPTSSSSKAKAASAKVLSTQEVFGREKLQGSVLVDADGHTVELTNLDKVYWPQEGYTKGDLLRYYYQIAPHILPYLQDRPLILQRFPNGIASKSFHQHNIEDPPSFLETFTHKEKGAVVRYGLCNNLASLLYIANLGAIAPHVWLSRISHVDRPDWVVFDLDPGEIDFAAVCRLALELREVLRSIGLEAYAKTSGSEGLHIYVPLEPRHTYDQIDLFTQLVATAAQARCLEIATLERSLARRPKNAIYLDYMQNKEGKSVVAPWAARAKPGATVSTPLTWAEVKAVPNPAQFTIFTVPARLKKRKDSFRAILEKPQSLEAVLSNLHKLA